MFSPSRDKGTIRPASWRTWLRNSLTESQAEESLLCPLPTVELALSLTNARTVDSWNADLAARTSLMWGITSCASWIERQYGSEGGSSRIHTENPKLTSSGTVLLSACSWGTRCGFSATESCVRSSSRFVSFLRWELILCV